MAHQNGKRKKSNEENKMNTYVCTAMGDVESVGSFIISFSFLVSVAFFLHSCFSLFDPYKVCLFFLGGFLLGLRLLLLLLLQ